MVLFHRTTAKAARVILTRGFQDTSGYYMVSRRTSGVWFSDRPLDANEGAFGDTLLRLVLRAGPRELRKHEWVEDGKGYREWQLPAALVNARRRSLVIVPQWREDRLFSRWLTI